MRLVLLLCGCSLLNDKVYDAQDLSVCAECDDLSVGDLGTRDSSVDAGDLQPPADLQPMCVDSGTCPSTMPVCGSGGACGPCSAMDDGGTSSVCAAYHGVLKLCGPAGDCVECLSKDDCAPTNRACDLTSHACAPCKNHSDCTTGVCNSGGVCATASEVAYVNNANGSCSEILHASTPAMPYCQAQTAATISGKSFVVVAGSSSNYSALNFNTTLGAIGPLTIIGPGPSASPQAIIAGSGAITPDAVAVQTANTNAADVTIYGLVLEGEGGGTTGAGAKCTVGNGGATLSILHSLIKLSGQAGVHSSGCTLTVDGCVIGPSNVGGGIELVTTMYTVTNNIVAENGTATVPGVSIDNGSSGTFAFNTVARNHVTASNIGGVDCGTINPKKPLLHSIIWGNDLDTAGGTQIGAKCTLTSVVVGADSTTDPGAIKQDPSFTPDYHLKLNDTANAGDGGCCVDKIMNPGTANSDHDVDSTHRPKGASWDVGAHEVQ
jgi:hypothetical protein